MRKTFSVLFVLFSLNVNARKLPGSDLNAESDIHFIGQTVLFRAGTGTHRRFFFKIYEVALFLQNIQSRPEKIIDSTDLKFVRLKFLRNLKANQISEGFNDTFKENCFDHCETLSPQLAMFLESISDMPKESLIEFIFFHDKTVLSMPGRINLSLPGSEFGKILLRAWLGADPPSERFKRELLQNLQSPVGF
jgi:hypothetical protein